MTIKVCAIKDAALNAFMQPFFAQSIGQAVRSFQDAVNDNTTPMHKHPEDYELWALAEFDQDNGFFARNAPELLIRGKDAANTDK